MPPTILQLFSIPRPRPPYYAKDTCIFLLHVKLLATKQETIKLKSVKVTSWFIQQLRSYIGSLLRPFLGGILSGSSYPCLLLLLDKRV
jgi:hypothetical protein